MMVDCNRYSYRVMWSEEDQEYVATCAEFPSLSHLAPTRTAALDGIVELAAEVVADMDASGEEPPIPFALREFSGVFKVRIPPEQHRKLAIEAKEQDVSMNRLIAAKLS